MGYDNDVTHVSRKPYHAPAIDDLGSLRELTAGVGTNASFNDAPVYQGTASPSS